MKRKNRTYMREFKLEAVRLSEEDDRTVAEVARELGIHPNNLYKWRHHFPPFPNLGTIVKQDGGWQWQPIESG